jgi:hypothetical protein
LSSIELYKNTAKGGLYSEGADTLVISSITAKLHYFPELEF